MGRYNFKAFGDYPNLWKRGLIQARVRERANHRCEQCGMAFQEGTNLAVEVKRRSGHPFVGTVHHIDGNKANCSMSNLVFLCQRCHLLVHFHKWYPGQPLPKAWWYQTPAWLVSRGLASPYSQPSLF